MLKGADLGLIFLKDMMQKQQLLINTFPTELADIDQPEEPIYSGVNPFLRNFQRTDGVALSDQNAYNILIVGPTGCGKSHLINMLYNKTACKSNASAGSVTKMIDITTGKAMILGEDRKVNIIDTIGFCDSDLTASEVLQIIQDRVKMNFINIDKVVVMCSGRVERIHADCAKKIMQWLKYTEYRLNFIFMYAKADLVPEHMRETNLGIMCDMLETGHRSSSQVVVRQKHMPSIVRSQGQLTNEMMTHHIDTKICYGINPGAAFEDVKEELDRVLDVLFLPYMPKLRDTSIRFQKRIPVQESWCSIL